MLFNGCIFIQVECIIYIFSLDGMFFMKQKKVGLFVNRQKDDNFGVTRTIVNYAQRYGVEPYLSEPVAKGIGFPKWYSQHEMLTQVDFLISLGGDGTLLNMARTAFEYQVPVLGINLGTVGFLADVEIDEIESAIKVLSEGKYNLKDRMVLSASVIRNEQVVFKSIALNDVVVSRDGLSRIIRLKVFVDDQYIDLFPGDGVIVSTPTGSTGYTLSAGGPIVQPDMDMMITTPICPHILYSRSFITSPDRQLCITINDDYPDTAIVTMDGQEGFKIEAGDRIKVTRAQKTVQFVTINDINFYNVLRAKIHNPTLKNES